MTLTDERLKSWLNGNQLAREQMCIQILALDRQHSDIRPRRPAGGPDGGRDIESRLGSESCFGAVGFLNSVTDSRTNKSQIKKKIIADAQSAKQADQSVKAFVFFCNVDLTPTELDQLREKVQAIGFNHVDIYWRERLRVLLDNVEGLAIRFQHLGIELSPAEQAAFFGRYGKDLENLVRGRFDRIEEKLDDLDFYRWRSGHLRRINMEIELTGEVDSLHLRKEHFRVCLEMQSVIHEKRSILLGARDDFWPAHGKAGKVYFGTKTFFWRQKVGEISGCWIPQHGRIGGGLVSHIYVGCQWNPISPVLISEFDRLCIHFHVSENLLSRCKRVTLSLDDYLFLDCDLATREPGNARPSAWPDELTPDEIEIPWRYWRLGWITLESRPRYRQ